MQVFRMVVCRHAGPCEICPEQDGCSYQNTFSQALADDPAALKRHQKPPLPFAFDLPVLSDLPNKGHEFEIGLTLAGSAINYVEDYISVVRMLFSQGNLDRKVYGTVVRVESVVCSDSRNSIMENGGAVALDRVATISARDLTEINNLNPFRVKLKIISPMRILQDGHPLREFSFSPFIRSLLRRISSLAYYYYGNRLEVDYKRLSAGSEEILIDENDFHWTDLQKDCGPNRLSGIVGSGYCQGSMEDFHAFLLLGEYFHVGKGSSFGLGRYQIEKEIC
jgi:hypothetical protein